MNTLDAHGIGDRKQDTSRRAPGRHVDGIPWRGLIVCLVLSFAATLAPAAANAATFTWSAAEPSTWSSPASWTLTDGQDPDGVPDADDIVIFDGTSGADATVDAAFDVLGVTVSSSYSGVVGLGSQQLSVQAGFTVEAPGSFLAQTGTVVVTGGAIESADPLFHMVIDSPQDPIAVRGIVVAVGDLRIESASALSGGRLAILGSLTVNAPQLFLDDSVISMVGPEDQVFSGQGVLPHLDIGKPFGTVNFEGQTSFERVTISDQGWNPGNAELTSGVFEVLEGGALSGDGTFQGPVQIRAGGIFAPSLTGGLVIDGDFTMDAGSVFFVESFSDGEIFIQGQATVTGTIELGGAGLDGFLPILPDPGVPILVNDGRDPIGGTFDAAPEGAAVRVGDRTVRVRYTGGDGDDLVLEPADVDEDNVEDERDNCPEVPNPEQADTDQDNFGDACDPCPDDAENLCVGDFDEDGIPDEEDNCPETFNEDQADADEDNLGDVCDPCPDDPFNECAPGDLDADGIPDEEDNCPETFNEDQADADEDNLGDVCDPCPDDPFNECAPGDLDADGIPDDEDNCPETFNEDQADADEDGAGDLCDVCPDDPDDACVPTDTDGDGIKDDVDNCIDVGNEDQADRDDDGQGDACDPCPDDRDDACVGDTDRDGVADESDNCVVVPNPDQSDIDGDQLGDVCDDDIDGDTVPNESDADPAVPTVCSDADGDGCDDCSTGTFNPGDDGPDADADGLCDGGDPDADGDMVDDVTDNCPMVPNADQLDVDADGAGDACDETDDRVFDVDDDGVRDMDDNCREAANPDQADLDDDGVGDACDPLSEISGDLVGSRLFGCSQSGGSTGAPTALLWVGLLALAGLWRRRSSIRPVARRAVDWLRRDAPRVRAPVMRALGAGALACALAGCAAPVAYGPDHCFDASSLAKRDLIDVTGGPTLAPEAPSAAVRAAFAERDDGEAFGVLVPEGTGSVALTVRGNGARLVVASVVQAPSGLVVWDQAGGVEANRTHPEHEPYTLLLPSQPGVVLEAGVWRVGLVTDAPDGVDLEVTASFVPMREAGTLNLNLIFVGVDGLNATQAQERPAFQKLLRDVEAVYQTAGVSFGEVAYLEVEGDDAKRFRVTSVATGELEALLALAADYPAERLNLFFVADLEGDAAGYSLFGQSGAVPGPATGVSSGVVVSLAALELEPETIQVVMAHEMGHFLGLYHTTERNGTALRADGIVGFDPLCDTPSCPDPADANGNRILSSRECQARDGGNLMFGLAEPTSRGLTAEQARVLRNHPLVK